MNFIDPPPQEHPFPAPPASEAPSGIRENPVFNLWDVFVIVVVAFFSLLLGTAAVLAIAHALPWARGMHIRDIAENTLVLVPAQVTGYVLTIGFMVSYIWAKYRTGFLAAVSWNLPGFRVASLALAGGVAMGFGSELLSALLQRWIPKSLPIDEYFRSTGSAYAMAAMGVLAAPAVEEVFFRGFLYPALARPLGVAPALSLTALSFAMLHSPQLASAWAPLLIVLAVGTILTTVRAITRSVATCVLIHMAYNFTLFGMAFIATQGFRHIEGG